MEEAFSVPCKDHLFTFLSQVPLSSVGDHHFTQASVSHSCPLQSSVAPLVSWRSEQGWIQDLTYYAYLCSYLVMLRVSVKT